MTEFKQREIVWTLEVGSRGGSITGNNCLSIERFEGKGKDCRKFPFESLTLSKL